MSLTGNLTELCLSELLQLISVGHHTGLLTICPEGLEAETQKPQLIWFQLGRIVAVSSPAQPDLLSMIVQRRWLSQQAIEELKSCPDDLAIGLWMQRKNLLQAEQLKLLFHAQVIRQICAIFKLKNNKFKFEIKKRLPNTEMTGLNLGIQEANLLGLRVLRDWKHLSLKLPDSKLVLTKLSISNSQVTLDPLEWQVWDLVDGKASLEEIAEQLFQPMEVIQKTAFRLIAANLTKEVCPLFSSATYVDYVSTGNCQLI